MATIALTLAAPAALQLPATPARATCRRPAAVLESPTMRLPVQPATASRPAPALPGVPAAAVETVRARVTELVPEYRQVHVETTAGRSLALTLHTRGIELAQLRVGQWLECVVTLEQPRVVHAHRVA